MKFIELPKEQFKVCYIDGDHYKPDLKMLCEYIRNKGCVTVGRKHPVDWFNVAAAFDIETTKVENINVVKGYESDKYKYFNIPFCWQFAIDDFFIFGRKMENFFNLLRDIQKRIKGSFVVWVHNIKFEYNNLADYFAGADVFFKDNSTPVYIRWNDIEFRCSAQLTHKSLAQVGKQCGYNKLKGDFDYSIERNEGTELTPLEVNYCYRDVLILTRFIRAETPKYCESTGKKSNPYFLPYTQTGYPRKDIKRAWSNKPEGRKILKDTALDKDQYLFCNSGFFGGYVHANYRNVGVRFLRDALRDFYIKHLDITSAYPSVMILRTFPFKMWYSNLLSVKLYVKNLSREDYAQIANLTLKNVRLRKGHIPYIPYAPEKMSAKGELVENGKIVIADEINITLTDVDMRLILRAYTFEIESVNKLLVGIKKHLPYNVVDVLLKYFEAKTKLKGLKDPAAEYEYNLSKQKFNGIYGLSASGLIHDQFEVNEQTFEVESAGLEYEPANVLPYQWAPYITAYVREIIYGTIAQMPDKSKYIYSDTDSLFYIDSPEMRAYVDNYNAGVKIQLEMLSNKYFNIIPENSKGEKQYLGTLGDENDDIAEFCTIGAKRYYIRHSDGFYDVTFSGLSATKSVYDTVKKCRTDNGFNTKRLLEAGKGDLYKAFKKIKESHVYLPYVEGIDKLSNYNVRYPFHGECCGKHYTRPCSLVLYPVDTDLTMNVDLFNFLTTKTSVELW